MVSQEQARRNLLSKLPEVQEQKKRFKKVFGEEVAEQVGKEEQAFVDEISRNRGGRTPGGGRNRGGGSPGSPPRPFQMGDTQKRVDIEQKEFQDQQNAKARIIRTKRTRREILLKRTRREIPLPTFFLRDGTTPRPATKREENFYRSLNTIARVSRDGSRPLTAREKNLLRELNKTNPEVVDRILGKEELVEEIKEPPVETQQVTDFGAIKVSQEAINKAIAQEQARKERAKYQRRTTTTIREQYKQPPVYIPKETTVVQRPTGETFRGTQVIEVVTFEPTGVTRKPTEEEEQIIKDLSQEVIIPDAPGKLDLLKQRAFVEISKGKTTVSGQAGAFAAGAATSVISTGQFIKSIPSKVADPIGTGKKTVEALRLSNILKTGASVGALLDKNPAFVSGVVAGEYLQFRGVGLAQKAVIKGSDFVRTAKLAEIKTTDVVAKEYFKGQKFPTISKGQTAGELVKEFKVKLPGETKAAGFTAAPKPISELTIRKGTSELPGLYQAPEISPHFLKVTEAEKKLVSFNLFGETLRPTTFRITPEKFELVPGLKETQTIIQSRKLSEIKTFFETAPKGKSYVPFVKTEKEAIIPFGSELEKTGKRFYFKFEGRRIPIEEFRTTSKGTTVGDITTVRDISKSLSSSKIGKKGLITPTELISVSKYSGVSVSGLPSSITSIKSTPSKSYGSISKSISTSKMPSISKTPSSIISSRKGRPSITKPSSIISKSYLSRYGRRGISLSIRTYPSTPRTPVGLGFTFKGISKEKPSPRLFGVAIRRKGKFRTIGAGLRLGKAISIGQEKVKGTLAATYKIFPAQKGIITGGIRTPTGFYRSKKTPRTFIEKRRFRLSTPTEVKEIKIAKRSKRK